MCVPRKIHSSSALLAIDIESDLETADYDDVIKTITNVVMRWNVLKKYSKTDANCQHFVDDLMESFGIDTKTKYKGSIGKILSNMRNFGKDEIFFPVAHDVQEKLGIKHNKLQFKTHKDLDEFVRQLFNEFPEYDDDVKYKEDRMVKFIVLISSY